MRCTNLKFVATAFIAISGLILSGCSATDPGAAGSSTKDAASGSATGTSQLAAIKAAGSMTFASDTSYAPAEFIGADGKPTGYDMEIAQAIAKKLGVTANVETAGFDTIIGGIGTKYNAGISSFTITAERSKQVNFVQYFKAGIGYAVAKGNPKKLDLTNLCAQKLAVQTGTIEDEMSADMTKKCTAASKPAIDIKRYATQAEATTNLVNGNVDIMFADSPVIGYAVSQTGGKLEQLGKDTDVSAQGIALPKSDTELATAVQKALDELIADGSYQAILKKWGVESGAVEKAQLNPPVS